MSKMGAPLLKKPYCEGISVTDPIVGLFMEDVAQERFITSVIGRIASEIDIQVVFEIRNTTGGIPKMRGELSRFLRDHAQIGIPVFDILIIAQDADFMSEAETKRQIQRQVDRSRYQGEVVVAAPEPYIEAWYLADPISIQTITGSPNLIQIPRGISEKDKYKYALSQAFPYAPYGGIEYADDIVANMDLYRASQNVSSLRHFIDELRSTLTQLASNS